MNKFLIPYGRQSITSEDIEAVVSTLKSDYLTQGPKVKAFEEAFAAYIGVDYAVAVSNATAGLHLAILALGIEPGDRVITTPITFAATANCVRYVGGEVWFSDIDQDTYCLDFDRVKELVESKPRGFFKAIIPVDFGGYPIDFEQFYILAKQHELFIIEDACHAPGGYFIDSNGVKQNCGNGVHSDMAVFSFHPVKHIACGEGGMVTTNSKSLYDKLNLLRSHGITKGNISQNDGGWYYEMKELGYNYRLTDFQSALGITQLDKNEAGIIRRNEIAKKYQQAFHDIVKFQQIPTKGLNAHHLFVIEVDDRKKVYEFLHERGILAQIHYIPVHSMPYYKAIGYADADLSNSETYYKRCISLPMYPTLKDEEQEYVIQQILEFINV